MPADRASAAAMGVGQGALVGAAGSGAASVSTSAASGDSSCTTALGEIGAEPTGVTRGRVSRTARRSAKPGGGPAAGALRAVGEPLIRAAGTDGSAAIGGGG